MPAGDLVKILALLRRRNDEDRVTRVGALDGEHMGHQSLLAFLEESEIRRTYDASWRAELRRLQDLEMSIVQALAHEVDEGDDATAEQLALLCLAERDIARAKLLNVSQLARHAVSCSACAECVLECRIGRPLWDTAFPGEQP